MTTQTSTQIPKQILQPITNFDVKIKNKDLTLDSQEIIDLLKTTENKHVSLFFCTYSENVIENILQNCQSLSIVDKITKENYELSQKYENNEKITFFLTHLTYEQYGEYCHQLKMMNEILKVKEDN